ncbi:MAG TPA: hypothetical protein VNU25_01500 [Candidatus Paceibacterota bacterium]|nr:hypothetical protein [Candidatus Paceibacterota bacterium]
MAGVGYQIGQAFYGEERSHRQGVLYADGNGYEPQVGDDQGKIVACAACIREETRVMLSGIPPQLQKRLKLDQVAVVTFVPGAETARESQDQIRLDDGRQFKLWELADQGVTLSLVMAETDSDTKTARMQPITEPAMA